MKNANLEPIPVFVWDKFLFDGDESKLGKTKGHLISVRARSNQALQFSVLLDNGALFTGLPAHAITFTSSTSQKRLELNDCQMWDCISDDIEVITLETLRYMDCEVMIEGLNKIYGYYLFTIDFVGYGLSRNPIDWKQFHAIKSTNGDFLLYPQYRILFRDKSLTEEKKVPKYIANSKHWIVGS